MNYRQMFPYIMVFVWFFSLMMFIMVLAVSSFYYFQSANTFKPAKYSIFSAKPKILGYSTANISGDDARAERIDAIFEKYNCPIAGYGEEFVKHADLNEIPYWLVAAVAFQESSCGKQVPFLEDGTPTYNLYGWGVWGENMHAFSSMENGIETVSKYMHTKFFSQGVTEPCEIMRVYTPPSKGSWCKGVNFFKDEIKEFESPDYL